jgi:hypothetical protein
LVVTYQSLLTLAGLRYERLTNDDLALELLRTLNPLAAYRRPWRPELGNRSLREWICDVGIEDEGPGWQQMNGLLYTVLTMKWLPEKSFPGVMRKLIELDFPVSCSAEIVIPGESKAHHSLTKRLTRTESAQLGANARARTDIAATVAGESITETLKAILAGRERLVESLLVLIHMNTVANVESANNFLGWLSGLGSTFLVGIVSLLLAIGVAFIPLFAGSVISGDIGGAISRVARSAVGLVKGFGKGGGGGPGGGGGGG